MPDVALETPQEDPRRELADASEEETGSKDHGASPFKDRPDVPPAPEDGSDRGTSAAGGTTESPEDEHRGETEGLEGDQGDARRPAEDYRD